MTLDRTERALRLIYDLHTLPIVYEVGMIGAAAATPPGPSMMAEWEKLRTEASELLAEIFADHPATLAREDARRRRSRRKGGS
jgi:hypothetical protein